MKRVLPPFAAIRAFEAAVRHGSFKAAGEELCVTQSAISHQVKKLEEFLGQALFHRKFDGVEPTPNGIEYFGEVASLLDGLDVSTKRMRGGASPDGPRAASRPSEEPAIVVLPFHNLSGDPAQSYFSDGITEDIITELGRFRSLRVIARHSSFELRGAEPDIAEAERRLGVRYVITGSVRKAGKRARISVHLVDAMTSNQLWAEHYDRDLEDVFTVQEEVVHTVVATLALRLEKEGRALARRKPPTDLEAYDFFLRGRQHYWRWNARDNRISERMFENAIARDPEYAPAHGGLAETMLNAWHSGWTSDLEKGAAHAERAVMLDDMDSRTHTAMSTAWLFRRDYDRGLYHIERAVALNPNDLRAVVNNARYYVFVGNPDRAITSLTEANHLDPFSKLGYYFGFAHYTARQYREAVRQLTSLRDPPVASRVWLAASHAMADQDEAALIEAGKCIRAAREEAAVRGVAPITDWEAWAREKVIYRNREDTEHLVEGMRRAGLN
jgi:TolB-like protein/Tfp pilus assembly protein PilF